MRRLLFGVEDPEGILNLIVYIIQKTNEELILLDARKSICEGIFPTP